MGVSNCYVFKSRLQEYTQKAGHSTPVYNTIKEGPSHEPVFKSFVVVNNIRYDSLPEFANRKSAEQSTTEVALIELAKAGQVNPSISVPIHETGLCKNFLQEYAQKMNYAIPVYRCEKQEKEGRIPFYTCSVEVGGVKYIGAGAKLKKDVEIKAARTALLSIHAATSESSDRPFESSQLTVVPCKKRAPERTNDVEEIARVPKAKKSGQCAPDHALVPTNGVAILQGTEDLNSTAGQNGIKACPPDALVPTDGVANRQSSPA